MSDAVRWHEGPADLCRAIGRWLDGAGGEAGGPMAEVVHDNPRRRLVRFTLAEGRRVWLKQFRAASGRHPLRERLREGLGGAPALREWRALVSLSRAGVPVPPPLARGRLANGEHVLVLGDVGGAPLEAALAVEPVARRACLRALGESVRRLHAAGWTHGDLHHGNAVATRDGVVLLDLQHARPRRGAAERLADLGHLDHSLATLVCTSDRVRVRAAALGLSRPFDAAARRALRSVGAAAARRRHLHAASRLRRTLRSGRAFAAVRAHGARGMRVARLPEADLLAALAAHDEALRTGGARVLEHDARTQICRVEAGQHRMVSKEMPARGLAGALSAWLHGSPARRAWRGGHGLRVLGVAAPEPLAFLEWRRLGLPVRSLVLLEDLAPDRGAHQVLEQGSETERRAALDALLHLLVGLHRSGAHHGDLKASNVLLQVVPGGFTARPVDLEDVRFPGAVPDAWRLASLAALNASVGDALDDALRCAFFSRYARALPFSQDARDARAAVVRQSLARRHRWTGSGCRLPAEPAALRRGAPRSTGT